MPTPYSVPVGVVAEAALLFCLGESECCAFADVDSCFPPQVDPHSSPPGAAETACITAMLYSRDSETDQSAFTRAESKL